MLTMAAVADAICAVLQKQWPSEVIHRGACPAEFSRPAMLNEVKTEARRTMNRTLYEESGTVTVTCFGGMGEANVVDGALLAEREAAVRTLFSEGFLRVGDRAVTVTPKEGTVEADRCKTVLVCRFVEERGEEETLPLMREIHDSMSV